MYFYVDGVPALSNFIAKQIPVEVDQKVGRELRKEILAENELDTTRTKELQTFYREAGFDPHTKVYVINKEIPNAFASPDNTIFIYVGLLRELTSHQELAALLSHEYIHIKNRHGIKSLVHSLSRQLLTEIITGGDKSETLVENAGELLSLRNSRKFEYESDLQGLELLERNRIPLVGMLSLLEKIKNIEQKFNEEKFPSYLSTHPAPADRIKEVTKAINRKVIKFDDREDLEFIFQKLTLGLSPRIVK